MTGSARHSNAARHAALLGSFRRAGVLFVLCFASSRACRCCGALSLKTCMIAGAMLAGEGKVRRRNRRSRKSSLCVSTLWCAIQMGCHGIFFDALIRATRTDLASSRVWFTTIPRLALRAAAHTACACTRTVWLRFALFSHALALSRRTYRLHKTLRFLSFPRVFFRVWFVWFCLFMHGSFMDSRVVPSRRIRCGQPRFIALCVLCATCFAAACRGAWHCAWKA